MAHLRLTGVVYVHAAAQDCKSGAKVPQMYRIGDVVLVDFADGTNLKVRLQEADIARGEFGGIVLASSTKDVELSDTVSFQFV